MEASIIKLMALFCIKAESNKIDRELCANVLVSCAVEKTLDENKAKNCMSNYAQEKDKFLKKIDRYKTE